MSVIREALKIDPCVGFFAARPRLGAALDEDPLFEPTNDWRPGSGMTDERRELPLPESEPALGADPSADLAEFSAASKTSFKKGFLVAAKSAICSSGTVSLFFSRKPSASYVTSCA